MTRGLDLADDIYARGTVEAPDGTAVPLTAQIPPHAFRALHRMVHQLRPEAALEVGLAYGLSALGILEAMAATGTGELLSLDPDQEQGFQGIGLANIKRAGLERLHTWIGDYDFNALPQLLGRGARIQFAYLDGWHTFDYTLLDFFYVDKMLDVGGVVAFNDCSWPAVHKVLKFVVSHRQYEEIDAGLPRAYAGSTARARLLARAQGRTADDRYFRKVADWEPRWDFFAPF